VIQRECLDYVGIFDEQIPRPTTQDYDLWLRVARYFEFAHIPEPLTLYRKHDANAINDGRTLALDKLYVLEKALEADPTLATQVGIRAVRERMAEIVFDLGYLAFDASDLREAKRYSWRMLSYRLSPYMILMWIATFAPQRAVVGLRRMKRQLAI